MKPRFRLSLILILPYSEWNKRKRIKLPVAFLILCMTNLSMHLSSEAFIKKLKLFTTIKFISCFYRLIYLYSTTVFWMLYFHVTPKIIGENCGFFYVLLWLVRLTCDLEERTAACAWAPMGYWQSQWILPGQLRISSLYHRLTSFDTMWFKVNGHMQAQTRQSHSEEFSDQ